MRKKRHFNVLQSPYDEKTFLLEEYKCLRAEIMAHLVDRSRLEAQVFIGVFVLLGWLVVNQSQLTGSYERIAFGLPIAVVVIGFIRWSSIQMRTMLLGKYIKAIEPKLRMHPNAGWENYLSEERRRSPIVKNAQGSAELLGWLALAGLTVIIYVLKFVLP